MTRLRNASLLLLPLVLLGCQPGFGESDVVGTWKGQVAVEDILAQEDLPSIAREMMKGMGEVMLTVVYAEDKTYTFDINLGFVTLVGNGNWTIEEERLQMKMTSMSLGNNALDLDESGVNQPILLSPSEDRKTLTGQIQGRPGTFTLTRAETGTAN